MNRQLRNALGVVAIVATTQAAAEVTFFEHDDFRGQTFTTDQNIWNFEGSGFNDRASSAIVSSDRWEVCEDARFEGRCVVLRPGRYPTLGSMGLNDRISSVREIGRSARLESHRYAPVAEPESGYDYRRRANEPLYEAEVTSVRAVVGPPEQRCWIEREQVVENRGDATIPGAIVGGVLGGIIGHQFGGGRGRDAATVGGAVGGAVIGGNLGSQYGGGGRVVTQDVQRCATVSAPREIAYWDVTYVFQGYEHRIQMTRPPGPTLAVNAEGEPRV